MANEAAQIQQVQIVDTPQVSPEDRMAAAMGLDEGPRSSSARAADGRFAPKADAAQQEPPAQEQEQQVEQQEAAPDESATHSDDDANRQELEIDPDAKFVEVEEVMPGGEKTVAKYSLNELKNQRMMQADYTRKTQEIAAQRRAMQDEMQKAVNQERSQYMATLQTLQQAVIQSAAPELANVNWSTLATENPAEYVRLSNRAREVQQAVQQLQQKQQEVTQRQAQERQQTLAQAVAKSREAIQAAIPDWSDTKYQQVMKRAVESYGFTPQEIGAVYDHRIIKALHDADQYRQMVAQKPINDKKLVVVPKVVKPGTTQRVTDKGRDNLNKSKERLRQTGSIDALADVFGQILK